MRHVIQFFTAAVCIGLVGAGLFMSIDATTNGIVLDRPGAPGRLVADSSVATAYFEKDGENLELTMLFSDEDEPESVFRTRVSLSNGQSHAIVVDDSEDGSEAQRFIFLREGDKVTMTLEPVSTTATASYTPKN